MKLSSDFDPFGPLQATRIVLVKEEFILNVFLSKET
jgi:hypothetical protein